MTPWYRGFRGSVAEAPSKTGGKSYTISGVVTQVWGVVGWGGVLTRARPAQPGEHRGVQGRALRNHLHL
jgi:hypothetical protein